SHPSAVQTSPAPHSLPQSPQLSGSDARSTHVLAQLVRPSAQAGAASGSPAASGRASASTRAAASPAAASRSGIEPSRAPASGDGLEASAAAASREDPASSPAASRSAGS